MALITRLTTILNGKITTQIHSSYWVCPYKQNTMMEEETYFSWSQDENGDKIIITCTSSWELHCFWAKITVKTCNKFHYQITVCKLAVLPSLYFSKGNTGFPKHLFEEFWASQADGTRETTCHVPDDMRIQKIPATVAFSLILTGSV